MLILSKSGHKSRAAIARPIESSRPIETAYRSQPDPKSAARCPKKTKSSDTAKRNLRETTQTHAIGHNAGGAFTKRPNAGTQARSASTSASSAPKL